MNLFFLIFTLYRLSTVYSGSIHKLLVDNGNLYVSSTYKIYKNGADFLGFSDIIQDFSVENDTVVVLTRKIGTFDTYVDVYINTLHKDHFKSGSGGKYIERGDGFYLIGTDFFSTLRYRSYVIGTNLYSAHVFMDSMIAGYIRLTNNFVILSPHLLRDTVVFDTVFYKSNVPFQRDFFSEDSSLFFIGFDGNLYELTISDSGFVLKQIFTDHDGSFYFLSIVDKPDGSKAFYISSLERTYVCSGSLNDSLFCIDSLDFVGADFAEWDDKVYTRSVNGILYGVRNGRLYPEADYPASFSNFRTDSSALFFMKGDFPCVLDFENPLQPGISLLDTVRVKDFLYDDTMFVYLSITDSLFLQKGNEIKFVDDSVYPGIALIGNRLYYTKNNRVIAFNLDTFVPSAILNIYGESVFEIRTHYGNLYIISVDSSGKYIFIRKTDTLLSVLSIYEIDGGGVYISPISPDFKDSLMFIPYIRQGINEYRISVLDLKNDIFTGEFMGYGSIKGIKVISSDSVFILEEPYGMMDLRLGIVDFNDSTFYEGAYIGTATGKSALLSFKRFLFVYTEGKLDVYLIPSLPISVNNEITPFVLMENVVNGDMLEIYSLYTVPRDASVAVYTLYGARLFYMQKRIEPGVNPINIDSRLQNGMFILSLKDLKSGKDYRFRFIYVR